jgi:hypothetical protein
MINYTYIFSHELGLLSLQILRIEEFKEPQFTLKYQEKKVWY